VLAAAASPVVWRAVRLGNLSVFAALAVGLTAWGLVRRRETATAAGVFLGGLAKYTAVVYAVPALILRQWRAVVAVAVAGAALTGVSLWWLGWGPHGVWLSEIAPTLKRPSFFGYGVRGSLIRWLHDRGPAQANYEHGLPGGVELAVRAVSLAVLGAGVLGMWRRRAWLRADGFGVLTAVVVLTSWLLLFGPVVWEHYFLFLVPLWGWVLVEMERVWRDARPLKRAPPQVWVATVWVGVVFAVLWCPWTAGRTWEDREPFGSSLLFAAAAVQAWSQWRLWRGGRGAGAERPGPGPRMAA